jgi:acetyl esterase/lipase
MPRRHTIRHATRSLTAAVLVALVALGCAVPDPSAAERVPLRYTAAPLTMKSTDIAYGADPAQRLDIYAPTAGGNKGVIVLVPGGGFVTNDRRKMVDVSGLVMAQTRRGFAVVSVSYRNATPTANLFPTAVRDVSAAVDWVRANASQHGLNTATVIIVGGSAGGTIASLVATAWNSPPKGVLGRTAKVDGWVSFAGIMDFPNASPAVAVHGQNWLGAKWSDPWSRASASPVTHLDRWDPPAFVAHGDLDTVVDPAQMDAVLLASVKAGVPNVRMWYDRVDTGEGGCRWHFPQCGVNAARFNDWVDRVERREL